MRSPSVMVFTPVVGSQSVVISSTNNFNRKVTKCYLGTTSGECFWHFKIGRESDRCFLGGWARARGSTKHYWFYQSSMNGTCFTYNKYCKIMYNPQYKTFTPQFYLQLWALWTVCDGQWVMASRHTRCHVSLFQDLIIFITYLLF